MHSWDMVFCCSVFVLFDVVFLICLVDVIQLGNFELSHSTKLGGTFKELCSSTPAVSAKYTHFDHVSQLVKSITFCVVIIGLSCCIVVLECSLTISICVDAWYAQVQAFFTYLEAFWSFVDSSKRKSGMHRPTQVGLLIKFFGQFTITHLGRSSKSEKQAVSCMSQVFSLCWL
jgi:hypothetical protein